MPEANNGVVALAIVGSNTTAIGAELTAAATDYAEFRAIIRRSTATSLPVAMDGEEWAARLKKPGLLGAGKVIGDFIDHITGIVGGRPFDCFIHHSKDPFSQLLSSHPLCRRYFYIEEGFTALTGGTFGRPVNRPLQKLVCGIRCRLFYRGRINRYRSFFDTCSPKYGGVFALSRGAFKGFPGRVQLDSNQVALAVPLPAPLVIFLDSQYFLGNCTEQAYTGALCDTLREIIGGGAAAAIKFHPGEKDAGRKQRIMDAVRAVPGVSGLAELPPSFVGERMEYSPEAQVVVGTSAIGLYIGERGFRTYTFAPRIAPTSEKYAKVVKDIPQEFTQVCQSV